MTNTTSSGSGRVRVGLVGAGGFGSYTADIIAQIPEIQLAGVADPDLESASRVAERYDVPLWSSHEELIAGCDCDAVAVVTPHNTHRDIAVAAARAGRHVFCEKAMAINAAECHEMIDAATAAGLDVFWDEPLDPQDSLLELDVLATPHAAGACNLFATKTAAAIAANIQRLAEQEPLQWLVNPA